MLRWDLGPCAGQMAGLISSYAVASQEQRRGIGSELLVAAAEVLNECLASDHHARHSMGLQPSHGLCLALSLPWSDSTRLFSYWPVL